MKRADDHNPFNPTPELSSLQRHAAQQVADGLLELRGKAKGSELPGMLGPLEFAYYEACALANPDFVALAQAYGLAAWRVVATADFGAALKAARAHSGPALIELMTSIDDISPGRSLNTAIG